MAERSGGSWIAFAVMAVVVVGLAGSFATFALPIPMQRAVLLDAALDEARAAAQAPDPQERLEALRPRLGDSADRLIGGTGSIEERIERERVAMRARFLAEEQATAQRLRWLTAIVTLMAAIFVGTIVGGLSRRSPPSV